MKNIYLLEIHFKKTLVEKIDLEEIEKILNKYCSIIEKTSFL